MFHKKQVCICPQMKSNSLLMYSLKLQIALTHTPLLSLFNILKLVRICNQQELPLQMAKHQETKLKYYKWPRISKWLQSEALVHYKHKNFSTWYRKSLKKHSNNTDLISWLEFLGMLNSVIQHYKKTSKKKKAKKKKLYSSVDIVNFVPSRRGTLIFVKLCPAGAFLHFSVNNKRFSLPAHQGLMC